MTLAVIHAKAGTKAWVPDFARFRGDDSTIGSGPYLPLISNEPPAAMTATIMR